MTIEINARLVKQAEQLSKNTLWANAKKVDDSRSWPQENFNAMKETDLLGIFSPKSLGGSEVNFSTFVQVMEWIGAGCGSTALCYLMHSTASIILTKTATGHQIEKFLKPIAQGKAIATLGQSEVATGSNFYAPEIKAKLHDQNFVLNGTKHFVTSGGHADLVVTLTEASGEISGLNMMIVEKNTSGVAFEGAWDGMGMSGNSSVAMKLDSAKIPIGNLLGKEGSGGDILFGINAVTFLLGNASLNIGLAEKALEIASDRAKTRNLSKVGGPIANQQIIRQYLGEMFVKIDAAKQQVRAAAKQQDLHDETGLCALFATKVLAAQTVIDVTNLGMQICGGQGYRKGFPMERLYRDARACSVMGPTSELLKDFIGKSLVGMDLL